MGLLVPGVLVGGLWLYLVSRTLATAVGGAPLHRSVLFFATAVPVVATVLL